MVPNTSEGMTILGKVSRMKELTDQDFGREVLRSEVPVLVCFITGWCQCYATCLFVDKLAERYGDEVKFLKMDVDKNLEVTGRYNITALPTILFSRNSQPLRSLMGFYGRNFLQNVLDNVIAGGNLPDEVEIV
jgi:thioredoxin 1